MKNDHLKIILACNNQTRSTNMAQRVRYQGHKVELVSAGFQTLHDIEKPNNNVNMVLFLGDDLDDMGCIEAISHLRVVKSKVEVYVIHIVDDESMSTDSLSAGSNIILKDDNFNNVSEAMTKALKSFK
jgi:hypothetical protein